MVKEKQIMAFPVVFKLYKRLRTKPYNNHYSLIEEFMTDGNLQAISQSPMGEEILLWVSHKMEHASRYLFWERILKNRDCFSDAFLASIWYELFIDCGNVIHQHTVEEDGSENDFDWRENHLDRLSESVITSPYLLDSATVIGRYCQTRKKGWRSLRYLHSGRTWKTLPAWKRIRDELADDNVPGFEIGRTLMGGNLSFSLIAEILNRKAWKIFRHLLENDLEELEKAIPLEEIVCHAVSQFFDREAISVLEMLEEVRPGIIAGFRDALGQNLLWYGMTNPRSCWFHPNCQLTAFLIQHGCSPDLLTHIGLSWLFLTNSLSDKQKSHIWGKRWSANKLLSEEQPNIWERQRA